MQDIVPIQAQPNAVESTSPLSARTAIDHIAKFSPLVAAKIKGLLLDGVKADNNFRSAQEAGAPESVYRALEINAAKSAILDYLVAMATNLNYILIKDSVVVLLVELLKRFGETAATRTYAELHDSFEDTSLSMKKKTMASILAQIEQAFPSVVNNFDNQDYYREQMLSTQGQMISAVLEELGL